MSVHNIILNHIKFCPNFLSLKSLKNLFKHQTDTCVDVVFIIYVRGQFNVFPYLHFLIRYEVCLLFTDQHGKPSPYHLTRILMSNKNKSRIPSFYCYLWVCDFFLLFTKVVSQKTTKSLLLDMTCCIDRILNVSRNKTILKRKKGT